MRVPNPALDRFDRFGWSLAAGVLLAASFPPVGLYPLAWVALVPLMVRWYRARTVTQTAVEVYAAFLVTTAATTGGVVLHPHPDRALILGLGLLAIPLPFALAFALSAIVRARLGMVVGLAALLANLLAIEALSALGIGGIPWLVLGHTQADATLFLPIAEVGGVGLLSLWVILANMMFFLAARARTRPGLVPGPRSLALLLAIAILIAPAAYGDQRVAPARQVGSMDVAVVQPGTPPLEWGSLTDGARVDSLARLSATLIQTGPVRPHLIVWPEGAIPTLGDAERERRLYERLGLWAQARGTTLLAGAWTTGRSAPAGAMTSEGYRSAALMFGRGAVQAYERNHLVPLAEHVPLAGLEEVPPEAHPPADEGARYAAGGGRSLMDLGGVNVATPIGAETLVGSHVAGFVRDGADVIISPAQTGWFAPAPVAEQHLRLSRLRAIETGRALLMATVSGPSALITPDGRITRLGADESRATFHVEVPIYAGTTGYVRHGDFIWHGGLVVSGLLTLVGLAAMAARRTAPRRRPARAPMARPALAGA